MEVGLLGLLNVVGEELGVEAIDGVAGHIGRRDDDLRVEVKPVAGGVLSNDLVRLGQFFRLFSFGVGGFRIGNQLDDVWVVVAPVEVGVTVEDDVTVVDMLLQRRLEVVAW